MKIWVGKCVVCGKTNGYFQRATYEDAPEGGVTVHYDCLTKFYRNLEDEQWKKDMEDAFALNLNATAADRDVDTG